MVQSEVFNAITTSLNQLGIRYRVDVPSAVVGGSFLRSHGQLGKIWFRVIIVNQAVVCYAGYEDVQIPQSWQMLRLIDLLNARMVMGNFEFESVSCVLRYRYAIPCVAFTGSKVDIMQPLVQIPVNMCDRCLSAFQRVVGGVDPSQAIQGI